jgi:hypothetical protein
MRMLTPFQFAWSVMTFVRIVISLYLLFEHDLRANISRLSRGKTGIHFSGSCSRKLLSTKFGWRLIPMWPFSETNAAAMRAETRRFMSPGFRWRNLCSARHS